MGPKLMNCWGLESMGTQEYGKMLKRIQVLEDGWVPAKETRSWRIEGQKRRITRKGVSGDSLIKFEMEGLMTQKGLWNFTLQKRFLRSEDGAFPKEEGDVTREYKVMHEENFFEQLVKIRWERERRKERLDM